MKNIFLATTVALIIFKGSAGATTYTAASGYSTTNPGLVWSHQFSKAGTVSYLPYLISTPQLPNEWWSGNAIPYSGDTSLNNTGSTISYLTINTPSEYIQMDPEAYDWVSVSFLAPLTGEYEISGLFRGIDTDQFAHDVAIYAGYRQIYSGVISRYGQVDNFSERVALTSGETLSFRVDTGIGPFSPAEYSNLSTGFIGSISSVPETSVWAAMFAGIGIVGLMMRRKRERSGRALGILT